MKNTHSSPPQQRKITIVALMNFIKIVLMKMNHFVRYKKWYLSGISLFIFVLIFVFSCRDTNSFNAENESINLADNVAIYISFESETETFKKAVEGTKVSELPENVQHLVNLYAIPRVIRDKQTLKIFKDSSYELVIEKIKPKKNPIKETFNGPVLPDNDVKKIVITAGLMTCYGVDGSVTQYPNNNRQLFKRFIRQYLSNPYFANHVNVGQALIQLSADATNYLDPKLKPFFVSKGSISFIQDKHLVVKQSVAEQMQLEGIELTATQQQQLMRLPQRQGTRDLSLKEQEMEKFNQNMHKEVYDALKQGAPENLHHYTLIDTASKTISATILYNGDEQVMSMTKYQYKDDAQKTILRSYSENFESNPFIDVDFEAIQSITYENVNIIKNN